jgi:hypothetical protein
MLAWCIAFLAFDKMIAWFMALHVSDALSLIQAFVLACTFVALSWTAWETRRLRRVTADTAIETQRLRQVTADQVRLSGIPLMGISYYRIYEGISDSMILNNEGPAVATAKLQGFRITHNAEVIRCTFRETRMLLSHTLSVLLCTKRVEPLSDTSEEDPGINLLTALRATVDVARPTFILELYARDLLGHAYVSDVEIDLVNNLEDLATSSWQSLRFRVSAPRPIDRFPDDVPPVDRT